MVVDDEAQHVAMLRRLLAGWGFNNVVSTTDSTQVVTLCIEREPDLVMVDLHMPGADGFEVMSRLLPWTTSTSPVPILMLTGDISPETRRRALAGGARDFVNKPFDADEVRLRVTNLLRTRRLERDLRGHAELLEETVRDRTLALEHSRRELLERLATVAEYRDDDTGDHPQRVGRTAGLLAEQLGLPQSQVDLIVLATPLHDLGKIAIPDAILLKREPLAPEERAALRRHVLAGAKLLGGSASPLIQLAESIVMTHHEHWDGSGYPSGLAGERIPIEGRIVAVADCFDTLTHSRRDGDAWPVERAVAEIWAQSRRRFDPAVVEAFGALDHGTLVTRAEQPGPGPAASSPPLTVSLSEAAQALAVSPATLRRWGDTGRIAVTRTAGGHRRFPVSEIRRLRASRAGPASASVRPAAPPAHAIPTLSDVLGRRCADVRAGAARALYGERLTGWFGSAEARGPIDNWLRALASACLQGKYDTGVEATAALSRRAELAGTSLLERHSFVERVGELSSRLLTEHADASRLDVVATRRLFACLRQSLLETATSPPG